MARLEALSTQQALAADSGSLNRLKLAATDASPQAIRETARQFESLFMRELVKSMRQATMKSGLLDNPGSDLGQDLLDQQLSVAMTGQPRGLGEQIASQMARQMGVSLPEATSTTPTDPTLGLQSGRLSARPHAAQQARASIAAYGASQSSAARKPTESQTHFVQAHSDVAARIERETGIPASFMIGQAGLETGWGQHQIRLRGGAPSNNLFGIKADPSWSGKVAEVTTTEYVGGVAHKRVARFRAYDSSEAAFRDYARLLKTSPRYAQAVQQTSDPLSFARGLQSAGYATDPRYAVKVASAIDTTQRLQAQMRSQALALALGGGV